MSIGVGEFIESCFLQEFMPRNCRSMDYRGLTFHNLKLSRFGDLITSFG